MQTANGNAIAGGAIVTCLIDMLVENGVLDRRAMSAICSATRLPGLRPSAGPPDVRQG